MDLKQQIDQLNEVIINFTENIEKMNEKLKEANRQRKELMKLSDKANDIMKTKKEIA